MTETQKPSISLPFPMLAGLLALLIMPVFPTLAWAETIRIVAIGASNTNGKGVGRSKAWPGQLQALLKQKGYNVRVVNKGVNGNTTSQMLRRLPGAIGSGTKVAIVAIPLTNDRRAGVNSGANIAAMKSILKKRGVRYVLIERPHTWAGGHFQSDRIHFTVAGHRSVALRLLPKVTSALK